MAELEMKTRQKIVEKQKARYKKASKKEKSTILDGICMTTGLSRSRAKHLLIEKERRMSSSRAGRSGRNPKYGMEVRLALEKIWVLMDFASGRRLCSGMDDMLDALLRFGECGFDEKTLRLLREISPSTTDRLLKRAKDRTRFKGRSTTKPGSLLKKNIPIRLGTEWDDTSPGFVEIDLVAHCGWTTAGEYVNTLDVTDISTGWTETRAVINKAQRHVFDALLFIRECLPFPLLGIDSDSGSEFINAHLFAYCKREDICFTRSRPYMKNDGCHVEQKNWHVVRRNIGYGRYEGSEAVRIMNEYYALLRLYTNFFQPHTKLILKSKDGARVTKRYETPLSPYRRLLADENISGDVKAELTEMFVSINPASLKRDMMSLLETLLLITVSE